MFKTPKATPVATTTGLKTFSSHSRKQFLKQLVSNIKLSLDSLEFNDEEMAALPGPIEQNDGVAVNPEEDLGDQH